MRYHDYLSLEGWCSIVLGLALALVAAPGLVIDTDGWGWWVLSVPVALALLGGYAALRRGVSVTDPGAWLTTRPLETAQAGREPLDTGWLRKRLIGETAVWIVAVGAWVFLGATDGGLIFGTGLASAAFGAVQAFAARAHVQRSEAASGTTYLIAKRPGLGTPQLTTT